MIAYASVYGNTAERRGDSGGARLRTRACATSPCTTFPMTHPSVLVAEAFRCSHLVFASTTYNAGIFVNMETALHDIVAHNLQNRTVALIENGTWAPTSGNLMRDLLV